MKGFTLAELMGVIVILGILAVVITTTIDRNITNSRYETCKAQEENLKEAAQMYAIDQGNEMTWPTAGGAGVPVYLSTLMDGNYIESDLKNPMTDKAYNRNDYVLITLPEDTSGQTNDPKNYHYEVGYANSETDSCSK